MAKGKVYEVEFLFRGHFHIEVDEDMSAKEVLDYLADDTKEHLLIRAEWSGNYERELIGARELTYASD